MSDPVIVAKALAKRYGRAVAVDGIDLTIERGEIFGLLGPNGAGKTTAILMLLGLTEATSGSIMVCGYDPMRDPIEVKKRVGYLPDSVGFYDNLTARENLRYSGRLAGIERSALGERLDEALRRVRLDDVADHKVATFSRGMRQRLGLAEVLMKRAEIAILDEPTNGLDPQSAHEFLQMIRGLRNDGVAVLLSSHILDSVQAVCDRVALFRGGRIAMEGSVRELAQRVLGGGYTFHLEVSPASGVGSVLAKVPGVHKVEDLGAGAFRVLASNDARAPIASAVTAAGGGLLSLNSIEPSLDAIYRHYFEEQHVTA